MLERINDLAIARSGWIQLGYWIGVVIGILTTLGIFLAGYLSAIIIWNGEPLKADLRDILLIHLGIGLAVIAVLSILVKIDDAYENTIASISADRQQEHQKFIKEEQAHNNSLREYNEMMFKLKAMLEDFYLYTADDDPNRTLIQILKVWSDFPFSGRHYVTLREIFVVECQKYFLTLREQPIWDTSWFTSVIDQLDLTAWYKEMTPIFTREDFPILNNTALVELGAEGSNPNCG